MSAIEDRIQQLHEFLQALDPGASQYVVRTETTGTGVVQCSIVREEIVQEWTFTEDAYPFNDPPENEGDPSYNLLGNWSLTGELPLDGHVVLVEGLDDCAGDPDAISPDFHVVKIGKVVG